MEKPDGLYYHGINSMLNAKCMSNLVDRKGNMTSEHNAAQQKYQESIVRLDDRYRKEGR